MGLYRWNAAKNDKLIRERKISFEEVVLAIEQGHLLDVVKNPNREKYKGQKAFVVEIKQHVYLVPFLDRGEDVCLKTIIPTRKLTKKYLGRRRE